MKVLFDHPNPFLLAHGGLQIQIEQTKRALDDLGVEVEWLRWWDAEQRGDILHFFGRPSHWYVQAAHERGMKLVIGELLTGVGSRGKSALRFQTWLIRVLRRVFFFERMSWDSFRRADAVIALTAWEARLFRQIFNTPAERIHTIPNGVEPEFFAAPPRARGDFLVCTATIAPRKRVLELAEAAVLARVPLKVIGRPYVEDDPYHQAFLAVARAHPELIDFSGPINDRAELAAIYRAARGFVLLSTMESLSLSALEAAACECPLLLTDLPWARTTFGSAATYCPLTSDARVTAAVLKQFSATAPQAALPAKPLGWPQVAEQLRAVYCELLNARI